MAKSREEVFLQVAQELGILTPDQARECADAHQSVIAAGAKIGIAKIAQDKGYVSQTDLAKITREMRKHGHHPLIGPYEIHGVLGEGGTAKVYRAVDSRNRRLVALKVLSPEISNHPKALQRFTREAELAGKVSHTNVASLYEVGREGRTNYVAMEFVPGLTLSVKAAGAPLPELEALKIVRQAAAGLQACHAKGIIHRDVKPSNIMVTQDGRAKLLDLGIAREGDTDLNLTATGQTLGTPYYMSPEQCASPRDVDVRSDIYSLGATLFYALTGRPPYDGDSALEIMRLQSAGKIPDPREFNPQVSELTHALLCDMMAKSPAHRHPSAAEVIAHIQKIEEMLETGTIPASPVRRRSDTLSEQNTVDGRTPVIPTAGDERCEPPPPAVETQPARETKSNLRTLSLAGTALFIIMALSAGIWLSLKQPKEPANAVPNATGKVEAPNAAEQPKPEPTIPGTGALTPTATSPAANRTILASGWTYEELANFPKKTVLEQVWLANSGAALVYYLVPQTIGNKEYYYLNTSKTTPRQIMLDGKPDGFSIIALDNGGSVYLRQMPGGKTGKGASGAQSRILKMTESGDVTDLMPDLHDIASWQAHVSPNSTIHVNTDRGDKWVQFPDGSRNPSNAALITSVTDEGNCYLNYPHPVTFLRNTPDDVPEMRAPKIEHLSFVNTSSNARGESLVWSKDYIRICRDEKEIRRFIPPAGKRYNNVFLSDNGQISYDVHSMIWCCNASEPEPQLVIDTTSKIADYAVRSLEIAGGVDAAGCIYAKFSLANGATTLARLRPGKPAVPRETDLVCTNLPHAKSSPAPLLPYPLAYRPGPDGHLAVWRPADDVGTLIEAARPAPRRVEAHFQLANGWKGAQIVKLAPGITTSQPSLSPDGRRLAFVTRLQSRDAKDFRAGVDLFSLDFDSGKIECLFSSDGNNDRLLGPAIDNAGTVFVTHALAFDRGQDSRFWTYALRASSSNGFSLFSPCNPALHDGYAAILPWTLNVNGQLVLATQEHTWRSNPDGSFDLLADRPWTNFLNLMPDGALETDGHFLSCVGGTMTEYPTRYNSKKPGVAGFVDDVRANAQGDFLFSMRKFIRYEGNDGKAKTFPVDAQDPLMGYGLLDNGNALIYSKNSLILYDASADTVIQLAREKFFAPNVMYEGQYAERGFGKATDAAGSIYTYCKAFDESSGKFVFAIAKIWKP